MQRGKFENWAAVVAHYGEYGQVHSGETAEQLADAALEQGEVVAVEHGGYRLVEEI
jgi:hypothetical protein